MLANIKGIALQENTLGTDATASFLIFSYLYTGESSMKASTYFGDMNLNGYLTDKAVGDNISLTEDQENITRRLFTWDITWVGEDT
ncbi:hypothetical protein HS088_TW18G00279 [Tripterygium wilfordii]|uniref:Uncharacterized protein n=1 Tax=Tripterygium wilfordii TaxID=458696 RepID=A0A7J7CBT6_TRIWF|nr:hypothetical protein HS088_TW18G00279 [Tripterygium wilfordii]